MANSEYARTKATEKPLMLFSRPVTGRKFLFRTFRTHISSPFYTRQQKRGLLGGMNLLSRAQMNYEFKEPRKPIFAGVCATYAEDVSLGIIKVSSPNWLMLNVDEIVVLPAVHYVGFLPCSCMHCSERVTLQWKSGPH